jgi:ferredoxin
MADKNSRFKENILGKYYVDDSCIACDACCVEAPKLFAMNDNDGHAFVMKQPVSPDDFVDAENARAACPVEAIGNDG